MGGKRGRAIAGGVALGVIVGLLLLLARPAIPSWAAQSPLARTTITGSMGNACLDRIPRGSGWMDLCWSVTPDPADADPTKDYYLLRVNGSAEGIRWSVIKTDLVGEPGDDVLSVWPEGVIEGGCRQVEVHFSGSVTPVLPENVCGRTTGTLDTDAWVHTVTWTCELCFAPGSVTRSLGLYSRVAVPAGTVPAWDVYADAGS